MERSPSRRLRALAFAGWIAVLLASAPGGAATRTMFGSVSIMNPDVAPPNLFEAGRGAFGKGFGIHPPTAGYRTIQVAGATGGTFPGRAFTVMNGLMNLQGNRFRDFPGFAGIAQVTKTFMTQHPAATFMNGGGALAFCPGAGCVASGMGTAISFCPPLTPSSLAPAPGTAIAQVGNWQCTSYSAAGPGRRGIRLAISNSPSAANFGGTLSLLRSQRATIWRVLEPPATPMALAVVERAWRTGAFAEAAGGPNFALQTLAENNGPHLLARLDSREAVTATFGCANAVGSVGAGKTFMLPLWNVPRVPITGPGNDCGTDPTPAAPGHAFGFRMTTGTLSGSDFFPLLDATTQLGTPFNPVFAERPFGQGMFFTRMGMDAATPTARNIVMLGGGIAYDPESGNAFFRVLDLRLLLQVPEPATASGLLAAVAFMTAFARARRRPGRGRSARRKENDS